MAEGKRRNEMIVKVFDKETEFFGDSVTGKKVVDHIIGELGEKNMTISHLIIDDAEVNNSHAKYIDKNIESIKVVEAVGIDNIKLAIENAGNIREALAAFPPIMDVMAEDFRQGVSARGWKEFKNMIDTFLYIDQAMKSNFAIIMEAKRPEYNMVWDRARSEYQKLYDILNRIEKALNYDHPAEAGDLIQKKVKPVVVKTVELLGKIDEVETGK